jgi:hypothetical protein
MNNMDLKRLGERVNLFTFLELLNKLDETQIPERLLKEAKHQAALKKQNKLVSYYSIPSYTDVILGNAENNAIYAKEHNMTMTGWSKELLIRMFGENSEIVNKVYPQYKGTKLSEISNEFAFKFGTLLMELIENQGYATEQQVLEQLNGYKEVNKVRSKRVLQETIDKYDLKRIRCNGELKKYYGISGDGYPFIIVKNK